MKRLAARLLILLAAAPAAALSPGTDLLVPAAARVGSWVTDLYVLNPGSATATVTVYWLVRRQANPDPVHVEFTLAPGATRVLEDVIGEELGLATGEGAFRVVADAAVLVNARIYSQGQGETFGQGFEGIPAAAATAADESTDVVGLSANAQFRTNVYALAGGDGATLTLALRDPDGVEVASRTYTLGVYQPMLGNILNELGGPQFDQGSLHGTVAAGSAVVGASKVDNASEDPTTLEGSFPCTGGGGELPPAGVYYGSVALLGRDRGVSMTLNPQAEVVSLSFEMGSSRPGCGYLFPGNQQFDPPLPLDQLLATDGVTFTIAYSTGQIEWTIRLSEGAPYLYYLGVLSGVASGSPGSPACDGPTGEGELHLGKQPL
jgi:hypothetical protein